MKRRRSPLHHSGTARDTRAILYSNILEGSSQFLRSVPEWTFSLDETAISNIWRFLKISVPFHPKASPPTLLASLPSRTNETKRNQDSTRHTDCGQTTKVNHQHKVWLTCIKSIKAVKLYSITDSRRSSSFSNTRFSFSARELYRSRSSSTPVSIPIKSLS